MWQRVRKGIGNYSHHTSKNSMAQALKVKDVTEWEMDENEF